ncbi:hypothetical protein N0V85_008780 [Neurospora sp. IMI 360204]|nr:hypothetical protein N0V85_008780 [Neurospora sp. IMI 360204]
MSAPVTASPAAAAPPIDVSNLFSVKGLVALVTGGGSGIGLMMTQSLASAGAKRIYIAGRRLSVLQSAANRINSSLPSSSNSKEPVVVPLECDVTSPTSLGQLVSFISSDPYTGYLNLLLCNAGVGGPQVSAVNKETGEPKTLQQFREEALSVDFDKEWEQTFRVNVGSVWYTAMACLELLDKGNQVAAAAAAAQEGVKEGEGVWRESSSQIVVTSSIAGLNKAAPGGWAYGVSKAAATHVGKQLSVLLPRWGIR